MNLTVVISEFSPAVPPGDGRVGQVLHATPGMRARGLCYGGKVLPAYEQLGTHDVMTWRARPSASNPTEAENGCWTVIAGEAEDEPDVYLEISAEHPKHVADFIVAAVHQHAGCVRFTGAAADVERERTREHARFTEVSPANPALPDALKLACLVSQIGTLAAEVTDDPLGGPERRKRLYAQLTYLAAGAMGWMESILSEEDRPF